MMFFSRNKKPKGNVRRNKPVVKPVKRPRQWLQPLLRGVVISSALVLCGVGVWKLNDQLSVSYWDIDAAPHVQAQIEAYLEQQPNKDYWHTRAAKLQQTLIIQVPDIAQLQVSRILPDGLLIKAQARIPMALWKDEQAQQVMLIDETGMAYRALKWGESIDLPVLRAESVQLEAATQMLLTLNKYDVRKLLNLSELIAADNGWRLNFTQGEQWFVAAASIEHDVTQILNLLNKPRWAQGNWRIDARIPERWFIRPARQEII
ncbi:MAG TPA: hypothetical protein EYP39_02480 [Ghiorsea sp.]|nr:hypothetical protein [Ghiorsea sp.]